MIMQRIRGKMAMVLLIATLAGAAACGDGDGDESTRVPAAADVGGTYDVTARGAPGAPGSPQPLVGTASVLEGDLRIFLPDSGIAVHGMPQVDGTVVVEGVTTSTDAIQIVRGTARIEERSRTIRITGSLDVFSGLTFEMARPVDADGRPFSDAYRLSFPRSPGACDCGTSADVVLRFAADGTGTMSAADEVDGAGRLVGQIGARSTLVVLVSPSGKMAIVTSYESPTEHCSFGGAIGGVCTLTIQGTLAATDGDVTTGEFFLSDELAVNIGFGPVDVLRGPIPRPAATPIE